MARNQPDDFDDDEPGYTESGTHSGSSTPEPAMYTTSSPSTPATHGSLGASGLSSTDIDLHGMGEGIGDASMESSPYQGIEAPKPSGAPQPSPAQEAASAAQQTATKNPPANRSSDPSPISMAKKRRNQPG